ncbi:hypothetical protein PENSPDRAFT_649186 [Peniophora sp. CONT]|nr:hypothetical protein PENSPDRAFT_649186 [Peniophora sp. CONT]
MQIAPVAAQVALKSSIHVAARRAPLTKSNAAAPVKSVPMTPTTAHKSMKGDGAMLPVKAVDVLNMQAAPDSVIWILGLVMDVCVKRWLSYVWTDQVEPFGRAALSLYESGEGRQWKDRYLVSNWSYDS